MIVETLNLLKNKNIKLIHLSTVGVLDLQNNKENNIKLIIIMNLQKFYLKN